MYKLLASTALALVLSGGAYAQDVAPATPMAPAENVEVPQTPLVTPADRGINADGWLATEIIGETIYNSTAADADSIGEVNDFVLDHNGEIGAVIVGVGGFLGIGQKNVAINWDELELATDVDGNNRLVSSMTREQLENAAEFNREDWLASASANAVPAAEPMAPAAEPMAPAEPVVPAAPMAPAAPAPADGAVVPDATPVVVAPIGDWSAYQEVATSEVTADELTGTTVYGAGDENIGHVGDIILSDDGQVDAVVIDFGGFLGIGTKPVAVAFDNLNFLRNENGDLVLRIALTSDQLDAAPEYDAEAYRAAPDANRLTIN
ncbi:MAG TPA: PRC-barrel domain-containing protein [Pelagibacterium sp.]|uniref:PRC-barrel domain-containing protein n=1 Tax=Pelagibacterium sp. TaxID=1967288 RepID=UPI002CFBA565|nr:PRC-barrel domain-containing protein [Pelagibacterium sp.]HWJ87945.1 PRC-barrel domain-containing protein [Pelagibacterium sp.]